MKDIILRGRVRELKKQVAKLQEAIDEISATSEKSLTRINDRLNDYLCRVEKLEKGQPVKKEEDKKVAVYAPEPWMKEKVAKTWGYNVTLHKGGYIYLTYDKDGKERGIAVSDPPLYGYNEIDFKDFCKQHGISDKPDIIEDENGVIWKVERWVQDDIHNTSIPLIRENKYIGIYKPQTYKRFNDEINRNE